MSGKNPLTDVGASHSEAEPDGKWVAISSENEREGGGKEGKKKKKRSCRESCNGDGVGE